MPKSKVRKKVSPRRRQQPQTGREAMIVPIWNYPDAIERMQEEWGTPEEAAFQMLMMLPFRIWNFEQTKVTLQYPVIQAETAGLSLNEWYDAFLDLHEMGGVGWDDANKAHYFADPADL